MDKLQQEAENYVDSDDVTSIYRDFPFASHCKSFIAGANSDYVHNEKIRFAIEQLRDMYSILQLFISDDKVDYYDIIPELDNKIQELEKQLK